MMSCLSASEDATNWVYKSHGSPGFPKLFEGCHLGYKGRSTMWVSNAPPIWEIRYHAVRRLCYTERQHALVLWMSHPSPGTRQNLQMMPAFRCLGHDQPFESPQVKPQTLWNRQAIPFAPCLNSHTV